MRSGYDSQGCQGRSRVQGFRILFNRKEREVKFKKPCLECGALSYETRCPTHLAQYQARRSERFQSISRKEKKKFLYSADYQRRAKPLRETATHCYLCGEPFTDRTQIQIDHCFPSMASTHLATSYAHESLAPSHATCNRAKSNRDYDPSEWPRGISVAKKYLPNFFR